MRRLRQQLDMIGRDSIPDDKLRLKPELALVYQQGAAEQIG